MAQECAKSSRREADTYRSGMNEPCTMKRRYPYVMLGVGLAAFVGFGILGWGWLAIAGWTLGVAGALMHAYFWVKEPWRHR